MEEAAQKLGYRPNIVARSLVRGKTNTILLCAFIKEQEKLSAFYGELINRLLAAISREGYYLQIVVKGEFFNGHPLDKREALLNIARNSLFEGLVVLSHWPIHYSEVSDLVKENFPFVIVNQRVEGEGVSYVDIDHYGGAKEAVKYLIEKGINGLLIARSQRTSPCGRRYRAYIDTLLDFGIPIKKYVVGEFPPDEWKRSNGKVASNFSLPTAVLPLTIKWLSAPYK